MKNLKLIASCLTLLFCVGCTKAVLIPCDYASYEKKIEELTLEKYLLENYVQELEGYKDLYKDSRAAQKAVEGRNK